MRQKAEGRGQKKTAMLHIAGTAIVVGTLIFGMAAGCDVAGGDNPRVLIQTGEGDIVVEVDTVNAPVTALNFLRYVDENRFATAGFYRVVRADNQPSDSIRIAVIQGGLGFEDSPYSLPSITHETTKVTGIKHGDGVISMARMAPGTASSEIFICVGDQPELDFGGRRNPDGKGFAAFGRVVKGMNVVRRIQQLPVDRQFLLTPVPWRAVKIL